MLKSFLLPILLTVTAAGAAPICQAEDGTWEKLADNPKDLAGRESPPGMDGTWVYVPEWKGFLLYGGCMPTLSNEGWFFDPDKREWKVLWPHDSLSYDAEKKKWNVLMPRDIEWSLDRPAPARAIATAYDPKAKAVLFFAGYPPNGANQEHPYSDRERWLGKPRIGVWKFDVGSGKFQHASDDGEPEGAFRAVYDSAHDVIVSSPWSDNGTVVWVYGQGGSRKTSPNGPRTTTYQGWAYDAKIKKCVLFNEFAETWTYDVGTGTWANMQPKVSPPPRRHAAMAYDEAAGVTILNGGIHDQDNKWSARAFWSNNGGVTYGDTWEYDGTKNIWTELKPSTSPPPTPSGRDNCVYDPDRKMCVFYDVAVGVWGFKTKNSTSSSAKSKVSPPLWTAPTGKTAKPAAKDNDPKAQEWQAKLKSLGDDSWLDSGVRMPHQGCMNIVYDPTNHALLQIGGCGHPVFQTFEEFSYNNQIVLLDMDVGKWSLRRNEHMWGPTTQDFTNVRVGNGCTRGFCYDPSRKLIWANGGNNNVCPGTRQMQNYDVATDLFGLVTNGTGGGESCQLAYDQKHDAVVTMRDMVTKIYHPKSNSWEDAGAAPPDCEYQNRVADPELGIIFTCLVPKDWKIGSPLPGYVGSWQGVHLDTAPNLVMRTYVFNLDAKKWTELNPAGEDKLPVCAVPGLAYDSKNRAVIFVKNNFEAWNAAPAAEIWILDLKAKQWKQGKTGPGLPGGLNMSSLTYDANHNVIIGSPGYGNLMFYRYKGGCPQNAFSRD